MRILQYILLIIILGTSSCTDLNEPVYEGIPSEKYPENAAQVASISVASYNYLRELIDDEGWWMLAQEVSSDEFCGPTRDTDWDDGGKWRVMHQHTWNDDVEGVNRMWEKLYLGTAGCNKIIELRIDPLLAASPEDKALLAQRSEVELMRSFYYYLIMDNYGDIPYVTTFINAPEQPLRNKRSDVFDSLVTTIEAGLPYYNLIDRKYMATRYMAFALLSKLYLNAEVYTGTPQWQKANQYIDSVLAGPYQLSSDVLAPFKTNNQDNSEIIFSIPFHEDTYQGFRLHMRTLHYQHNLTYDMPVGPWNGLSVTYDHFKTYSSNDSRLAYFIYGPQFDSKGNQIIESTTKQPLVIDPFIPELKMSTANQTLAEIRTTGARVKKFEIAKGAKENLSNDFPLFRLSDFYLMKAEVQIRMNNNGDQWVNDIRERAGLSPWTNTDLDSLLAERGRELFVEGHRRQDLIRFGKWSKAWWEKDATDGSKEVFPIPKWAKDANPNLAKDAE